MQVRSLNHVKWRARNINIERKGDIFIKDAIEPAHKVTQVGPIALEPDFSWQAIDKSNCMSAIFSGIMHGHVARGILSSRKMQVWA
jgi:hypothetical protein